MLVCMAKGSAPAKPRRLFTLPLVCIAAAAPVMLFWFRFFLPITPAASHSCPQAELAKQRDLNARMRHELAEQAAAAEEAAAKEEDEAGQLAAAQVGPL